MRKHTQNSGLTLIELMVTLGVLSAMFMIGVPQFKRMTETNRIAGSINSLVGDLKLARTEAAKRSQIVTVCSSTNGLTCANSASWESGWLVFSDENRDTIIDANDIILSSNAGLPTGFTLSDIDFVSAGIIQYLPSGALRGADPDGTFILCESTNNDVERARGINISNMGRVSRAPDLNADKTREDIDGNDLACP